MKTWADILPVLPRTAKICRCVRLLGICFWLAIINNATAGTAIDAADPVGFFTTVADKLLRNNFSFGVTNIPVATNGVFVYSPAVQRLLQLSANLYDATTTNFYPTVFRPMFNRDNSGNVFITGYQQVVGVTGFADPQLATPMDISYLPTGISSNANVYGVPWIIVAKKYLPNFNEFYSFNTMQVTRKLQIARAKVEGYNAATASDFATNQLFVMSVTNHIGFSFWNSYATNYPGGPISIYASDTARMVLTNGAYVQSFLFFTNFAYYLTTWPGSAWDTTQIPAARQAAPSSFISGTFDFPFLPASALVLDQNGDFLAFSPMDQNPSPTFIPGVTSLPTFPQFGLITTNWFQAFILDGSNVIDYVQFSGPTSSQNLSAEIQDPNFVTPGPYYYMWSTNLTATGLNWGVQNQLTVSRTGQNYPVSDSWISPPNMPVGLRSLSGEAAFFAGFFTPTFTYNGKTYVNTNLTNPAPYTPTRTVVSPTIWVANDPLVHYFSSDLNEPVRGLNVSGVFISDDPLYPAFPLPLLNVVVDRYQPWGRDEQFASLNNVDHNAYNLAYRDPLVYGSDDWNFPSGHGLPLTTLGHVHRGTPWQTFYLKAENILDFVNGSQTWMAWTGDADANDAALSAPVNDWRLAGLLAALFNTNDPTQLMSVNDTSTTDWLNILGGITVQTNSTPSPIYYDSVSPELDAFVMSSNSPQASFIANAIAQTKTAQPGQTFKSIGDFLATPELTVLSPWLNTGTSDRIDYGISDEAYEMIPAQLLPLLRADSIGAVIKSNGGWSLQFSGSDGFVYAVQTSTDLVNWEVVSTNCPQQGVFSVPMPFEPDSRAWFYRSVLLQ